MPVQLACPKVTSFWSCGCAVQGVNLNINYRHLGHLAIAFFDGSIARVNDPLEFKTFPDKKPLPTYLETKGKQLETLK
jgi:hypothetical protein